MNHFPYGHPPYPLLTDGTQDFESTHISGVRPDDIQNLKGVKRHKAALRETLGMIL
jgi:hypothetical protein